MKKYDYYKILWLLPVFFAIHNAEELPSLTLWFKKNIAPQIGVSNLYTSKNLMLTMVLLTSVVTLIVAAEYIKRSKTTLVLVILSQAMILSNSLIHLVLFFIFRDYVPGLLSAVFLIIPFSVLTFYLLIKQKYITKEKFIVLFLIGSVLMNPIIYLFLSISTLFSV